MESTNTDIAAGRSALLLCDTTEMADALNQRLHHDTINPDAPTVTGSRGHRLAVNDLILTRHNDATIALRNTDHLAAEQSPVRNGQRWQVTHINPKNNGLAARRLDDNTMAVFPGDFVRQHITHGYALTVHSAQGVTADCTHAILSETATRALAYVAVTRGRQSNTAFLYRRELEDERQLGTTGARHVTDRGTSQHAAVLLRGIVANDQRPMTAHEIAASTAPEFLPILVRDAIKRRALAVRDRVTNSRHTGARTFASDRAAHMARARGVGVNRSYDEGLEL